MNRRSKLRTRAPLALGATMAATSLSVQVRRAHAIGRGHRPVQLRWRRPVTINTVAHSFTQQAISVTWAPRISLHFGVAMADGRPHRVLPVPQGVSARHRGVQRVWSHLRTTVASQSIRSEIVSRSRHLSDRLFRRDTRPFDATAIGATSQPTHRASPIARRLVPAAPVAYRSIEKTSVARFADRTLHSVTRWTIRSLAESARQASPAPPVSRASMRERVGVPPRVTGRPVELTWRRSTPSPSTPSASMPLETAFAVPASRRSTSTAPSTNTSVSPAALPTRAFSLDANQLDRLTDDVIRRVERRVRIARERRGL